MYAIRSYYAAGQVLLPRVRQTHRGPDHVTVQHGDTDQIPYGIGTYASRNAVMAGGAATVASRP